MLKDFKLRLLPLIFALTLISCEGRQAAPTEVARWVAGPSISSLDLLAVDLIDAKTGWAVGDIEPAGTTSGPDRQRR